MAPILHLVRHAQGFHNLGIQFHSLLDPRLTPLGETQCLELQKSRFPPEALSKISLITASPLTRTLHTAYLVFRPILDPEHSADVNSTTTKQPHGINGDAKLHKIPPILAIADAQETSSFPCDTGTELPALNKFLRSQEPPWPVETSLLTPDWHLKTLNGRNSPHSDAIKLRARDARRLLRSKVRELEERGIEDPEVVLVAHGALLHYITGDWEDAASSPGTGWRNCEVRSYNFVVDIDSDSKTSESEAYLVETAISRKARGLSKPMAPAGSPEQGRLFEEAMSAWEEQGLERPDRLDVDDAFLERLKTKLEGMDVGTANEEEEGALERQKTSERRASMVMSQSEGKAEGVKEVREHAKRVKAAA